jgi:hypothetical protein
VAYEAQQPTSHGSRWLCAAHGHDMATPISLGGVKVNGEMREHQELTTSPVAVMIGVGRGVPRVVWPRRELVG